MHYREAVWLLHQLSKYSTEQLSPLLNLGSSTRHFRSSVQPWIDEIIFRPLEYRNVKVVHCDIKDGDGVDVAADILDETGLARLQQLQPCAVICSNLMEHVLDPAELALRCLSIVPPGGLLFVTVPHSYPYHRDPIDTLYRPSPQELGLLFAPHHVVAAELVAAGSYRDILKKQPWKIMRHVLRFPFPFLNYGKWKRSMKKLYWLFHDYQISCVVIRKKTV